MILGHCVSRTSPAGLWPLDTHAAEAGSVSGAALWPVPSTVPDTLCQSHISQLPVS